MNPALRFPPHPRPRRLLPLLAALCAVTQSCTHAPAPPPKPRSITALMWTSAATRALDRRLVADFTRQTGIDVELLPAPESTWQRLHDELNSSPTGLDVIEFDLAWSSRLRGQLADLRTALSDRLADELPGTVESAAEGDHLMGAPFFVDYGLLFYRTDLLDKYGFRHPPATWDELEKQAGVIQRGERAAGHRDFWGYVWQGDAYEGLTCNALEWQYSHSGGNIVNAAGAPGLANRNAVAAFAQAARWVGTISPPGVLAYLEEDSRDVWQSGNAAFLRNWAYVYTLAKADPQMAGRFAVSVLPAGSDAHSSVLGGWYLGIPMSSHRQADATTFVRFMTSRQVQVQRAAAEGNWPTLKSAYDDPQLKQSAVYGATSRAANRAIRRPVASLGSLYPCVSDIYAQAVHRILSGKISAAAGTERAQADIATVLRSNGRQGCQ